MQSLLQNLMMKFISLKYLTKDSTAVGLHTFKGTARKNKALNKIKVGTKVKCLFAEPNLLPSEKQKKKKTKKLPQILCKFCKLFTESTSF